MIGTLLVFALGFMAAALAALLFTPFLWQKAQRLARRRFDAEIPASVREMQGEVDAVRARAAFDLRREEMRSVEALGRAAAERSEAGRTVLENGSLRARQAEMEADLAERGRRFEALEQVLAETRAERDDILRDRAALREAFEKRGAELESLHVRHAGAQERTVALQDRLAHLERRLADFEREASAVTPVADEREAIRSDAPKTTIAPPVTDPVRRPATETPNAAPVTGGDRLRAAIAAGVGARAPASRAENADIRERISDLAARVIRRQVDAEGPTSPIAAILSRDDGRPSPSSGEPTLAERVAALAPNGEPPVAQTDPSPPKGAPTRKDGGGRSRRRSRR